jgi:hypothetical protein
VAFTPGARSVVYSAKRGGKINLYERAIDSSAEHAITTGQGPDVNPQLSADGSTLAFANRTYASTVTVFDGKSVRALAVRSGVVDTVTATADFRFLIAQRNDPYENGELIESIDVETDREQVLGSGLDAFPSLDGERVYFRPADLAHGGELHAVSIHGGSDSQIARFPGQIVLGVGARDGVHVIIQRDDLRYEGWKIASDGAPAPEGVAGLVMPSPTGEWIAVQVPDTLFRIDLFPRGAPLDHPTASFAVDSIYPRWVDDTHIGAAVDGRLKVVDVTRLGQKDAATILANSPERLRPSPLGIVGPGGRWAAIEFGGTVKRQLISNFGARPWR